MGHLNKKFLCGVSALFFLLSLAPMHGVFAQEETPSPAEGLYQKATFKMDDGDFEKAEEILEKAIELDSQYAPAHYALAVCLIRKKEPNPAAARKSHQEAVALGYQYNEWLDNYITRIEQEKR